MRIVNRRKFKVRMLELNVLLSTMIITPKAIDYANAWRGYKGFGGERLIPLIALIVIMILEEVINEH